MMEVQLTVWVTNITTYFIYSDETAYIIAMELQLRLAHSIVQLLLGINFWDLHGENILAKLHWKFGKPRI